MTFDSMNGLIYFSSEAEILKNLSDLTGIPKDDINSFIDTLEQFEKGYSPKRAYWNAFVSHFGIDPAPNLQGTVLFHGCRCPRRNTFDEGLLPNHKAIDLIWNQIWEICSDLFEGKDLFSVRNDFEKSEDSRGGGGYFKRLEGFRIRERGPWGILVRDAWFLEPTSSDHYLRHGPEIVSCILNSYPNPHELRERYIKNTEPCIVHFRTDFNDPEDLGHGIRFLRDKIFCENIHEITDFYGLKSMEGIPVPKDRILKIEFV